MANIDVSLPRVHLETNAGSIVVEIDIAHAPVTGTNFLRYVDRGLFDGATFYRAIRPDRDPSPVKVSAVQGGLYRTGGAEALNTIIHESTEQTGLRHVAGTLSMARLGVGTAASEFFIVLDDSPQLDAGGARQPDGHGFAAFGRVVTGMEVLQIIQARDQLTSSELPGSLVEPVAINKVQRLAL